MIDVSYILKKIDGKWEKIDPNILNETNIDGIVIKTKSGKVFVLTEKKQA